MLKLLFLFLSLVVYLSFGSESKAEVVKAEVSPDGETTSQASSEPSEFESLPPSVAEAIARFQRKLDAQDKKIAELTKTIRNLHDIGPYVSPHLRYMHEDILLDTISSRSYDHPFLVARPISIRLSQRDVVSVKEHEKHGKLSARTKRRFLHFVVALTSQNIIRVYDVYQNELARLDLNNESQTHNAHLWGPIAEDTTFVCDVISAQISGAALIALGRSDSPIIRVFSITAWRQFDQDSPNSEHIIGEIVEDMMFVPGFVEQPNIDSEPGSKDEQVEKKEVPTVSRVALYSKRRAKFFLASYSDVSLRVFRRNGSEYSTWNSPNGTKITALAFNNRKLEAVAVTDAGFQFVRMGRLRSFGPFCPQPNDTTFVSAIFDQRHSFRMYAGSIDGRIFVYNTKTYRKNDLCNPTDIINVQPKTPVYVSTLPGYVVAATSIGIHFFNTSSHGFLRPELQFVRRFDKELGLEQEYNDEGAPTLPQPLVGIATDVLDMSIVVMAQTRAFTNNPRPDQKFGLIILDSYIPPMESVEDKKGFLQFFRGPMLLCIGVGLFMFQQYNSKRMGGGGGGPFGKLFNRGKGRQRGQRGRMPNRPPRGDHRRRVFPDSDSDDGWEGVGGTRFGQKPQHAVYRSGRPYRTNFGSMSDSD